MQKILRNLFHAKANSGFTLVEIIVSTALFVVVVSAMVGLYIQAIQVGRRADTLRTAAQNARDLSEYLTKEIRNGTIDYGDAGAVSSPCTASPAQGDARLALLNVDGDHLCVYLGDAGSGSGNPAYDPSGTYLYVIKNSEPAQLLNAPNLAVHTLRVYLLPLTDPSSGSSQEETVTVLGSVQAVSGTLNNTNPASSVTIPLDASVSIPDYGYAQLAPTPTPTPTPLVCGAYTVQDSHGLTYGTVLGPDGKCWLDRNLGATRVATSQTDASSYGYLYQWGRLSDGHEITTSTLTSTLSSTDVPGNASFITINSGNYDWRSPQNDSLWQGASGINNPCPAGFRIPTDDEWSTLSTDAGMTTGFSAAAYASSLKLTLAGNRGKAFGAVANQGTGGYYWSSSVSGSNALAPTFSSSSVSPASSGYRAAGLTVRCIGN